GPAARGRRRGPARGLARRLGHRHGPPPAVVSPGRRDQAVGEAGGLSSVVSGPVETIRLTLEGTRRWSPAAGRVPMTVPAGNSSLGCSRYGCTTLKPASSNVSTASSTDIP